MHLSVSHRYTILWIGWIAYFLAVEIPALVFHRSQGDTLSEHVWKWFAIGGKDQKLWRARRFALLASLAWLCAHFLTGGKF